MLLTKRARKRFLYNGIPFSKKSYLSLLLNFILHVIILSYYKPSMLLVVGVTESSGETEELNCLWLTFVFTLGMVGLVLFPILVPFLRRIFI